MNPFVSDQIKAAVEVAKTPYLTQLAEIRAVLGDEKAAHAKSCDELVRACASLAVAKAELRAVQLERDRSRHLRELIEGYCRSKGLDLSRIHYPNGG